MHQVNLNDRVYEEARRRAQAAGFSSVDDYVADVLSQGFQLDDDNLDRFFTPERLAHIDRSAAQIDAGQGLTLEQARADLARRRDQWVGENPG